LINGSFGIKKSFCFFSGFDGYLGFGPSFTRMNLWNRTCIDKQRRSRVISGVIVKSGLTYSLSSPVYLNLFVDYLYQPVNFHHTVDLGGVKIGLGIGVKY